MGIATKSLFIVPHSHQMSFPIICLLSFEVPHISFWNDNEFAAPNIQLSHNHLDVLRFSQHQWAGAD